MFILIYHKTSHVLRVLSVPKLYYQNNTVIVNSFIQAHDLKTKALKKHSEHFEVRLIFIADKVPCSSKMYILRNFLDLFMPD